MARIYQLKSGWLDTLKEKCGGGGDGDGGGSGSGGSGDSERR